MQIHFEGTLEEWQGFLTSIQVGGGNIARPRPMLPRDLPSEGEDNEPVEADNEEINEKPVKKERKKREMTPEQREAMLERLAAMRQRRADKIGGFKTQRGAGDLGACQDTEDLPTPEAPESESESTGTEVEVN